MRSACLGLLAAALFVWSVPVDAQGPGAPPARGAGPGMAAGAPGAEFFLARTGQLRLTDAQVVRLAAIARRAEERRSALRASMDTIARAARPMAPMDSAARAARARDAERMRTTMERQRELARADTRDALAVLTPEQQALAWEMGGTRARMVPRQGGPAPRQLRRGAGRGGMPAPSARPNRR
ncbi:MAG TPA: Spy/CpxP family protein refolding chaperone [Gemmatimonadaceae bacterium]|nr:Spy/CpxP family protein refolding chaperone [Gemmatimonadaceae bacterium]